MNVYPATALTDIAAARHAMTAATVATSYREYAPWPRPAIKEKTRPALPIHAMVTAPFARYHARLTLGATQRIIARPMLHASLENHKATHVTPSAIAKSLAVARASRGSVPTASAAPRLAAAPVKCALSAQANAPLW